MKYWNSGKQRLLILTGLAFLSGGSLAETALYQADHKLAANYQLVAKEPGESYMRRGHALRHANNWRGALQEYQAAHDVSPNLHEALFWQAEALLKLNNTAAAHEHLQRFLQKVPGSAKGWMLMAAVCKAQKDYSAGVYALEQTIRLDDKAPLKAFLNRAYLQVKAGEKVNRIFFGLDQALIRFPNNVAVLNRAIALAGDHQAWARADFYWQQVPAEVQQQANWLLRRAQMSAARGDERNAEEYAKESLSAWQTLPKTKQKSAAMRELKGRIDSVLVAQE